MTYIELLLKLHKGQKPLWSDGRTVSIDPGGTTGLCVMDDAFLTWAGQFDTKDVQGRIIPFTRWLSRACPKRLVVESYRVYGWKTDDHAWQDLHTSRLIGAIEYWATKNGVPIYFQSAQQAKTFCTDEKLQEWGPNFYVKGKQHARDAVRHNCYWHLFGPTIKNAPAKGK